MFASALRASIAEPSPHSQTRVAHVEHDVEVLSADVLAVGEGDCAVHGADQAGRVRQPHVEEARLDQDQLVVLIQLQKTCRQIEEKELSKSVKVWQINVKPL